MSHPSSARTSARRSRAVLLAAALAAVLGVLGSVGLGAGPAHAAQHAITIKQYMFMPGSMSIEQGDTITWTNQDSVGHDVQVTSGPATFHSPMLAQGQSWSFTFSTAGTYSYICSVHPDMRATVTVAAAPAPPQHHQAQGGTSTSGRAPLSAAAPVAPVGRTATQQTVPSRTRTNRVASTQAAVVAPAADIVTPGSDAALDPLLLVGGVAVSVVVFCLLLLTSRPERPLLAAPSPGETVD